MTIPAIAAPTPACNADEEWRPVAGFEGFYEVSSLGRVRSLDRVVPGSFQGTYHKQGRILKPRLPFGPDGYETVALSDAASRKTNCLVHRLVAAAFLATDPEKSLVHHIDANRRNNRAANLERVSAAGNSQRTSAAGRVRNQNTKINGQDVAPILTRIASGESLASIARSYSVSWQAVANIRDGHRGWDSRPATAPQYQMTSDPVDLGPDEIWRDVPDYAGLYQISSLGSVRSLDNSVVNRRDGGTRARKGRTLKFKPRRDDYQVVSLSKNSKVTDYLVHRLVATVFVPKPEGATVVNHRDFNKANNAASNLEWCTQAGNLARTREAGRYRNSQAKLTIDDVRAIRLRLEAGEPKAAIARAFGVSTQAIAKIANGTRWLSA